MGSVYGYVRVSSIDQNEDRQLVVMKENRIHNCKRFYNKKSAESRKISENTIAMR